MKLYENTALNLRIRMPITSDNHRRNFITKIVNYDKICSIKNSMSVLPELLPKIIELAEQNVTGALNFTNPGSISHNEILEMYREIIDPEFEWQNFTEEEQSKVLACGRSNNYLNTDRLECLFPDVKHIKDSVRDILILMKENIAVVDEKCEEAYVR